MQHMRPEGWNQEREEAKRRMQEETGMCLGEQVEELGGTYGLLCVLPFVVILCLKI